VLFSDPEVFVAVLMFLPVPLPLILQFRIMTLSVEVINVLVANLITEVFVTLFAAVFVMVRLRLVPSVLGLSPSIVTLSAPFNSIKPRPRTVGPDIVSPSLVGRMSIEV
jgi:hypothetical protein